MRLDTLSSCLAAEAIIRALGDLSIRSGAMTRREPSWRRWARLARTAFRSGRWRPMVHPTASLEVRGALQHGDGQVRVGADSHLVLGDGVVLAADIIIGTGCRVTVGAGS